MYIASVSTFAYHFNYNVILNGHSATFHTHTHTHTHTRVLIFPYPLLQDLVPKGVPVKRTEVLENKVDRMWVSNAFFEWTHVKSSTSDWSKVLTEEKVCSSLDCLWVLVMKHINTHNVRPRDILEPLTPKTKLSDNWFYMHYVKWYLLCANWWLR